MTTLEQRIEQLKQYRAEADPVADALYIEDLDLSIAMFEKMGKREAYQVMKGFDDAKTE